MTQMLRVAFVDHAYHRVTKSADFFVEVLRQRFDVTVYYAGVQAADLAQDIVLAGYDIIVLWQTEYMSPLFIAAGQRVVCIPMHDGTGQAPGHFWQHMQQARVISFCHAMHLRLTGFGLTSLPVRYMKNPASYPRVTDYSTPRAVFWQRLPEQGLDAERIRDMLGPNVSLHVHNAPDLMSPDDFPALPAADSVSYFDLDRNALAAAMDEANIFVCPRYAEGIGMAMLEAMARGMVVIAHDAPTHNEYIRHGANGLLTDLSDADNASWPIDLSGTTPYARPVRNRTDLGLKGRLKARLRETAERGVATAATRLLTSDFADRIDPRVLRVLGTVTRDPQLSIAGRAQADDPERLAAHLETMGDAARAQAATLRTQWAAGLRDMLDFIEETPRPTGIRVTPNGHGRMSRDTELWLEKPDKMIALMARWEAHGIVLRDRTEMERSEKLRLMVQQNALWRAVRIVLLYTRRAVLGVLGRVLRRG